ncbi:41888_t:CDS:2, partial [Gigaspora margarita]
MSSQDDEYHNFNLVISDDEDNDQNEQDKVQTSYMWQYFDKEIKEHPDLLFA